MATLIGVVSQVVGEVFAVAGDGARRALAEGDRVFAGEQLVTGASGAVAIALVGGGELTLGRDSNLMLDTQLLAGARGEGSAAAAQGADSAPSDQDLADVEQLQAAIEAGEDPTASLEATAAGPGAGAAGNAGGGHSFVLLGETAGALEPVIGFPTEGLGFVPEFPDPDVVVTAEEPNSTPAIEVVHQDFEGQVIAGPGVVDEAALAAGSNSGSGADQAFGRLSITSPDGIAAVQVQDKNGNWVDVTAGGTVQGQYGTLVFDAAGNWTYSLSGNTLDHSNPLATGAGDQVGESFGVRVIDTDGDVSPVSLLNIVVYDDGPAAVNDSNSLSEDTASVGGNVLTNDIDGADGGKLVTTSGVSSGSYGQLALGADGTYTYTLNTENPVVQGLDTGESLTETFTYTMQDADGDLATAALTITITGSNDIPQISVDPGNQGANDQVFEAGLANGSDAAANSEFATGTFTLSDADGLDDLQSVTINGTTVAIGSLAGSSFAGTHGTLTITAYNAATGVASYSYELTSPTTDGLGIESDSFSLSVFDGTASSTSVSIVIEIVDDLPNAVNDNNSVGEDAVAPITGSVLDNDLHPNGQPGADTPTSFVGWAGTAASYGSFSDTGNGTYSYTLNNANPAVQTLDSGETLTETFTYTMQDADGDLATATLTITITGSNDIPQISVDPGNQGANDQVFEAGLAAGSDAGSGSNLASGTFTLSDADGLDDLQSVTINSTTVAIGSLAGSSFAGTHGTLTITAYNAATGVASYSYELTSPTTDGLGIEIDSFSLSVFDGTASSTPVSIVIEIVDDLPNAVNDSNSVGEDAVAPITGNVLDNDLHPNGQPGADTPTSFVGWAGTSASYGSFSDTGNGTYSYTLNNANPAVQALGSGETLTETFTYTMQDADGDLATATLTITITGSNDIPQISVDPGNQGANDQVFEAGLANGSDAAANSEFATGTFTLSDADGLDSLQSVTINGTTVAIGSLAGSSFAGTHGTLTITAYDSATGVASYSYELTSPTTDGPDSETDVFSLSVSDGTASSVPASIVIEIIDDVPTAHADTNSVAEGGVVNGNVLTDGLADVFGADGAIAGGGVVGVKVGGDTATPAVGSIGALLIGSYGTLVLNANGSYTYDGFPNVVPPAGASDLFTYTIRDADGDLSTTTLTIDLSDSGLMAPDDNEVVVYENALDLNQDGADLAAGTVTGSLPGSTAETDASNQLNGSGGIGNLTYSLVGSATGSYGTIQINADGSYVYTLTSPYTSDPASDDGATVEVGKDSFTYQVMDANGNTATGTIRVDIVDDVPCAFAPVEALLVDQVPTSHTVTAGLNFAGAAGADGVGTVIFSNFTEGDIATDADGQPLFFNGEQLYLHYGTDQTQLVAKTADNDIGYTVDIDPLSDTYTVTTHGVISNGVAEVTTTNLSGVGAGNVNFKGLVDIGGTTQDALISSTTGSINSDIDDIGIANQWISTAENVRFDFVNGLATGGANGTGFVYTDHNTVFGFRQKVYVQGGPGNTANLIVMAIIANNDYVFGSSGVGETQVNLATSDIKVFDGAVDVTNLVTLVDNGASITISGMQDGWTFQIVSDTAFSAVYIEGAADTDEFSLGFFTYTQAAPGQPIDLSHAITATDGDGDAVSSAINATLYPATTSMEGDSGDNVINGTAGVDHLFGYEGNDTLNGLLGDDVLSGGNGDDILIGGLGNDLMSGGAGSDIFRWLAGGGGSDTITDFVKGFNSGGDQLDLSELLVGEHGAPGDLGNLLSYIDIAISGLDTVLNVSSTAVADPAAAPEQTIVLQNVDLYASYGVGNEADLLLSMLGDGTLKVDTV